MKRTRFLIKLAFYAFFISLVSFAPPNNAGLVVDVLSQTNQFRKSKGLPGLIIRDDLNAIAQKHSSDMARGRVGFGHSGFEKRNALASKKISPMRSFAENVAFGASTGKEVVTMWKNSSGHRKNMLGRFKYIGIGTAKDRQGRIYYTQVFAG
jgi:uncharacterized protein YkwD